MKKKRTRESQNPRRRKEKTKVKRMGKKNSKGRN